MAAVVCLLAPLGIAEPAVRTAVSRMTHQGWLRQTRIEDSPGYALTEQAEARLDESARRLAAAGRDEPWDGWWHLLLISPPNGRAARDRLNSGLRFIGYGPLFDGTTGASWIAARASTDVEELLAVEGASADHFHARHDGGSAELAARA